MTFYRNKNLGTRPLELGSSVNTLHLFTFLHHYKSVTKKHNRITHAEKFQIIYVATLSSGRESTWLLTQVCTAQGDFPPKTTEMGQGE